MTGYGFTGPMTARGTVFDAKGAGSDPADTVIASYPCWQTTVTCGSGLGGAQAIWDRLIERAKTWRR